MSEPIEVSDLTTAEIRELLADDGMSLSEEQARQLAVFVSAVGGLDNALAALRELPARSRAA